MAIALDALVGSRAANTTTLTLTTTNAVAAGAKIVLALGWANSARTLTSVTDGGPGLTWSVVAQGNNGTTVSGMACADAPAGMIAGTVITAHLSASAGLLGICAVSFTGLTTGGAEASNTNHTAVTAWNTGAFTTTTANTVLVAFNQDLVNGTAGTWNTPVAGYTEAFDFGESGQPTAAAMIYQIVSSAGSYTPGGTEASTSGFNMAVGAAFPIASGGGGPIVPKQLAAMGVG